MLAPIGPPICSIAFLFALLVSCLSVSVPVNTARAADCLTAPNSPAPAHSRWYYRTDPTHQRKCWHLGAADQPSQQRAAQTAREAALTKQPQSMPAATPYSLASFKAFILHEGGTNLSDEDVKKLYTEFLEWRRHAKN